MHQLQSFTYLGVPLLKETKRRFFYDDFIQKGRSRILGWASRLLSYGRCINLLMFILSSIPLYLLQIMQRPKAILKKLEIILHNSYKILRIKHNDYIGGAEKRFVFQLIRVYQAYEIRECGRFFLHEALVVVSISEISLNSVFTGHLLYRDTSFICSSSPCSLSYMEDAEVSQATSRVKYYFGTLQPTKYSSSMIVRWTIIH